MGEAWIYAAESEEASEAARLLASLGFSPRRVAANGSLRPKLEGGSPPRRPDVALVFGGDDMGVCARLRQDSELGEVPVLLTVDTSGLDARAGVLDAHELLVAPFSAAELETRIARARRA